MPRTTPKHLGELLIRTCDTCARRMVSSWVWTHRSTEYRAMLSAAGYTRGQRADRCRNCCQRAERADSRQVTARTFYTRAELLAEWDMLHDRHLSVRANCRALAPRLGMKWASMERALLRAGVRTMARAA